MANKRKRAEPSNGAPKEPTATTTKKVKKAEPSNGVPKQPTATITKKANKAEPFTIQIVAGSYDRVLHGITATITPGEDKADFADTFLFNAHSSAIRCIALSPPSAPEPGKGQKVMLATGSTDERINVFNISAHPPSQKTKDEQDLLSKIAPRKILENPKNREVGALLHHSSTVTKLAFPTKGKLISASEDSTIAVTRIRDMTVLSSIKVPIPVPMGRPSGDTAAMGGAPSGVNDFAVHPSMKLMISVSKGERSMRLWNLMTAKKAGVLNFGRDTLAAVGEGRHSPGEGRKIAWEPQASEEFAVGFDRNILVFGMDGTPKCSVMPDSRTKIHEFSYVQIGDEEGDGSFMAVSTEDGRIMFFSTKTEDLSEATTPDDKKTTSLPIAKFVAQLGGKAAGVQGRIKDFGVLRPTEDSDELYLACGSSDGKIRAFRTSIAELQKAKKVQDTEKKQVGKLLGTYETQNRITCLEAFVMIPRPDGIEDSEDDFEDVSSSDDEDEDEDDE
ncbi:WD40-repeat-containing domain protein [Pestalotiopsis sp. NC0098]|nr:WD40-repeat-containing domain protein [Pestalotiopsis sp. NC0098]